MATITEFAQRILIKRPTVARSSEGPTWPVGINPTRACEPRTEITRPKEVTAAEPDRHEWRLRAPLCKQSLDKLLNLACARNLDKADTLLSRSARDALG